MYFFFLSPSIENHKKCTLIWLVACGLRFIYFFIVAHTEKNLNTNQFVTFSRQQYNSVKDKKTPSPRKINNAICTINSELSS